jgi:hypothetical protein
VAAGKRVCCFERTPAIAITLAVALALVVVRSGTSAAGSELGSPGATLDQSNPTRSSACRYTGWAPDAPSDWAAQTFTAGLAGKLTEVVVLLRPGTAPISVTIAPVDAGGQPLAAMPLASTSLSLPATSTYLEAEASFSTPARVETGKQYAIVVSSPTGDGTSSWAWKADVGAAAIDPAGTPCASGLYQGGRAWPLAADADFFFQTYVVPARRVQVSKVGAGAGLVRDSTGVLNCGLSCAGEFFQAQTLTLTATPNAGSRFAGWSGGGCSGTAPSCSVTVDGDIIVTAEFSKKRVPLTVRTSGGGTVRSLPAGINCGRRCSHNFEPGTVKLTAKPAAGWQFTRWQRACRGTNPVCRLNLVRAGTATAVFTRS